MNVLLYAHNNKTSKKKAPPVMWNTASTGLPEHKSLMQDSNLQEGHPSQLWTHASTMISTSLSKTRTVGYLFLNQHQAPTHWCLQLGGLLPMATSSPFSTTPAMWKFFLMEITNTQLEIKPTTIQLLGWCCNVLAVLSHTCKYPPTHLHIHTHVHACAHIHYFELNTNWLSNMVITPCME